MMADDEPIPIALDAPAPATDEHSAPFWAGLAERRIVLQHCASCARHRFPRMPACPYCGVQGGADIEVTGAGTVYSFVRAQRALTPAYAEVAPYAIATVDLEGGARLFGRVIPSSACAIGLRVVPAFADHPDWTELCFRPAPADE